MVRRFSDFECPFGDSPADPIVALLVFVCPVLMRLLRQYHLADVTPEWLESFSPSAYRPMELLLADDDFNFLVRQPGFESSIGKKLRQDRVRISGNICIGLRRFQPLACICQISDLAERGRPISISYALGLAARAVFGYSDAPGTQSVLSVLWFPAKIGQPSDCAVGRDEHLFVLTLGRLAALSCSPRISKSRIVPQVFIGQGL